MIIPHSAPEAFMLNQSIIERINGKAVHEFECSNQATIMIYGEGKLRSAKIKNPGDSFTWLGCELSTRIGKTTENCSISTHGNVIGHISFGPYEKLPSGSYIFDINYTSEASTTTNIGTWDVVLALPNKAKELKSGSLLGTSGKQRTISDSFFIPTQYDMEKIEIRNFVKTSESITIYSITISRKK